MTRLINPRHRQSVRLRNRDYAKSGAYFIKICTHQRECLLGEFQKSEIRLNELGKIVQDCWYDLPKHYSHIVLDEFVIMPNHVHGIIILRGDFVEPTEFVGAGLKPAHKPTGHEKARFKTAHKPTGRIGARLKSARKPMESTGAGLKPAPTPCHPLSEVVCGFKTFSAKRINQIRQTQGTSVWQRNYFERILRSNEINRIREYIRSNPSHWSTDEENPENI